MASTARSLFGDCCNCPDAQLLDGGCLVCQEKVRRVNLVEGWYKFDPCFVPHGPCYFASEHHVGSERDLNRISGRKSLNSINAKTGSGKIDDPNVLGNAPAFQDRRKADALPRILSAQKIS